MKIRARTRRLKQIEQEFDISRFKIAEIDPEAIKHFAAKQEERLRGMRNRDALDRIRRGQ